MNVYEVSHTDRRDPVVDGPGGPLKLVVDALIEAGSGREALRQFATAQGFKGRDVHLRGHTSLSVLGEGSWRARKVNGTGEEATLAHAASVMTNAALSDRLKAAAEPRSGFSNPERRAYMLEAASRLDRFAVPQADVSRVDDPAGLRGGRQREASAGVDPGRAPGGGGHAPPPVQQDGDDRAIGGRPALRLVPHRTRQVEEPSVGTSCWYARPVRGEYGLGHCE